MPRKAKLPKVSDESQYQICVTCKKKKELKNYYSTPSDLYENGKYPICKKCLTKRLPLHLEPLDPVFIEAAKKLLGEINRPFIYELWMASLNESKAVKKEFFGIYMKNLSLPHNRLLTWQDSVFDLQKQDSTIEIVQIDNEQQTNFTAMEYLDDKNREFVIQHIGYDPFIMESEADKRSLYNKLVDFLDESTLEDSFKLPAVIEIVKSFNQVDKLNATIATLSADPTGISQNIGTINSLITTKEKILKSTLALAKDNGISVNHNNNKSKGAGTLSGIIKQLQEKGIESAEVNLYDIETCEGMKQVADISNKSIFEQLMLNENDYTEMIKDQREMILSLNKKVADLEEENRLLKVKLKFAEIEECKRLQLTHNDE